MIQFFTGGIARSEVYQSAIEPGDAVMIGGTDQRAHRVTAIFQDVELSFDFARDASLAKLAEQLCILGEIHGGLPLAVNVRLADAALQGR
jgi:hypothetical protein